MDLGEYVDARWYGGCSRAAVDCSACAEGRRGALRRPGAARQRSAGSAAPRTPTRWSTRHSQRRDPRPAATRRSRQPDAVVALRLVAVGGRGRRASALTYRPTTRDDQMPSLFGLRRRQRPPARGARATTSCCGRAGLRAAGLGASARSPPAGGRGTTRATTVTVTPRSRRRRPASPTTPTARWPGSCSTSPGRRRRRRSPHGAACVVSEQRAGDVSTGAEAARPGQLGRRPFDRDRRRPRTSTAPDRERHAALARHASDPAGRRVRRAATGGRRHAPAIRFEILTAAPRDGQRLPADGRALPTGPAVEARRRLHAQGRGESAPLSTVDPAEDWCPGGCRSVGCSSCSGTTIGRSRAQTRNTAPTTSMASPAHRLALTSPVLSSSLSPKMPISVRITP